MHFQEEYLRFKGERVRIMEEVLSNINFIKANVLEFFFLRKVQKIRKSELDWIKKLSLRTVYVIFNAWISPALMTFATFYFFVRWGGKFSVSILFTSLFVMRTYQGDLTFLPNVIGSMIDFMVSSKRITEFMLTEKLKTLKCKRNSCENYDLVVQKIGFSHPKKKSKKENKSENGHKKKKSLNVKKGKLNDDLSEKLIESDTINQISIKDETKNESADFCFELKNLNLKIKKGELVAVIGQSGCGKSSLFLGLTGELIPHEDEDSKFVCNESVSFVSQSPWILNETIKNNILMDKEYNKERFENVVKLSNLKRDFEEMKEGEETIIGSKGSDVSGGQKIRIALARSLYSKAEMYLFDDVLSAFDVQVSESIFNEVICSFLKNKTRIISTHNISLLEKFDRIIFMEKGAIIFDGNFEELKTFPKFETLRKIECSKQIVIENKHFENKKEEEKENFKVKNDFPISLKEGKTGFKTLLYRNMNEEVQEDQAMTAQSIQSYVGLGSKFFLGCSIAFEFCFFGLNWFTYLFYNEYTKTDESKFEFVYFFKMLAFIQICSTILPTLRGFSILMFGLSIANKLSTLMAFRLIHASIGRFFQFNSSGKVLNRFSSDLETVDKSIPVTLSQQINLTFFVLLQFILMSFYSSPFLIVFIAIFGICIFKMRNNFVKKLKQVAKLDLVSKSPFFNFFGDTIYGLSDIRTSKQEDFVKKQMQEIIDNHVKCGYLLTACYKWFRLRVSLFSLIFMIPCCVFILIGNEETTKSIPVILFVMIQNIEYFISLINISNETERVFVAYGRCYNYTNLYYEKNSSYIMKNSEKIKRGIKLETIEAEAKKKEKPFPSEFGIEFVQVSAKYKRNSNYVLKDLSFKIEENEKIGIIGRTGAGKSSITKLMLNFVEYTTGKILISGINAFEIDVKRLRKNLSYVSQETNFFEGTLRENLDMFGIKSDEEILELLREAEMSEKVSEMGGLYAKIENNGDNLSVGEKQILCFTRTIINLKNIVILDEATSSMDLKSEEVLEKMKKKYLKNCTIICIAHRLNTLHDSDRIFQMESGKIKNWISKDDFKKNEFHLSENDLN